MALQVQKTEHAGAKNGGGHRGSRVDAKTQGKKARRLEDRRQERAPIGA